MAMSEIVRDFDPATLRAVSEDNYAAFLLRFARTTGGPSLDTPELAWGLATVGGAFLNAVARTRFAPGTDVDAHIAATQAAFRARGQALGWWIMPSTRPADLPARLEARGFVRDAYETPAMTVDLDTLPGALPAPPELAVREALDPLTLRLWVQTFVRGMEIPAGATDVVFAAHASLGAAAEQPYRTYLARLDGVPVATASLFLAAGVAGIVAVSTVPEARGQGIGAAVTLAPLLEARRLGYRIGTLMASPMGAPVYRRMGFTEVARFAQYVWTPLGG
jgi:GNAT superfamily N-acetyltransferase